MSAPHTIQFADSGAAIDDLDAGRRALLCCLYNTSDRAQLARLLADETPRAIAGGVVRATHGKAAVAELIVFHLDTYIEQIETEYRATSTRGDPHDPQQEEAARLARWTQRFESLLFDRGRTSTGELAEIALRVRKSYLREDDLEGHHLFDDLISAYSPIGQRIDDEDIVETFARLARDLIRFEPQKSSLPITPKKRTTAEEVEQQDRLAYWATEFAAFLRPYRPERVTAGHLVAIAIRAMAEYDPKEDPKGEDLLRDLQRASRWLNDEMRDPEVSDVFADYASELIQKDSEKPWLAQKGEA